MRSVACSHTPSRPISRHASNSTTTARHHSISVTCNLTTILKIKASDTTFYLFFFLSLSAKSVYWLYKQSSQRGERWETHACQTCHTGPVLLHANNRYLKIKIHLWFVFGFMNGWSFDVSILSLTTNWMLLWLLLGHVCLFWPVWHPVWSKENRY